MTRFYNAHYLSNMITPAPAPRLRLRLRDVLANPRRYFVVNEDGRWFNDPDHFFEPGEGLIEAIESAVNRKIRAEYDAALTPLSPMPRQVWDWLWRMHGYATAWWCDPKWDFYEAPLTALSVAELRRLQGAIEAFQRFIPLVNLLDWWENDEYELRNTAWEDEAADDLRAAYLTRIKAAITAKLKAEAKARTLAKYAPRPLTHRPFATALAGLAA